MKILYQDQHIIVCIKPSGVLSTDEPGGMPERIKNELGAECADVKTVHRLDRTVSGLMVFALSQNAASTLSRQITEDSFQKEYLAILEGIPAVPDARLDDLLLRNSEENKTYVVSRMRKGVRPASLEYKTLAQSNGLSLVRIHLLTGRTHQIRAQFSSRKLPLYGDRKYGSSRQSTGIGLWSYYLSFVHPTSGKRMEFSALPPKEEPWTLFPDFTESYEHSDVSVRTERHLPNICPYAKSCGGCQFPEMSYQEQLKTKQNYVENLLGRFGSVRPMIGMNSPEHYRNKVISSFGTDKKGKLISGMYQEASHRIVPVDSCRINNEKADEIIKTVRKLLTQFKIPAYDEQKESGWLRHVLVRTSGSGDAMVILVAVNNVFKSKNAFLKALTSTHPEIKTVILNINDRFTPVVLGREERVIYGPGWIEDEIHGLKFKISPDSFFQVNHVQTEILYAKALEFASLKGNERVIDAYCGTGTIGICAASSSGSVLGIELNKDAIHDAVSNAKRNHADNIRFVCADAGDYMTALAKEKQHYDVVFMDPPRSGSTEEFLNSLVRLNPERVVYISCNPETLARDLQYLEKSPFCVKDIQPVDMFPYTSHVETVVLLSRA